MRGLDKLALVSKVLLDQRVIELRREVEELRLRLFWKDHSKQRLEKLMGQANSYGDNAPKCVCLACGMKGRIEDEDMGDAVSTSCTFAPWFKERLVQCGLTFQPMTADISGTSLGRPWMMEGVEVFDVDVHFLLATDDLLGFFYGTKLYDANSTKDPELQKLAALFDTLDEGLGPE